MKVINLNREPKKPVDASHPFFIGPVSTQFLVTRSMGKDFGALVVYFDKGARNKFHSHSCDQLLYFFSGKGIVATDAGETPVEAGDFVFVPAGEKHWHGARKDTECAHIAIEAKGATMQQLES